jgi:uncharacterized SAM-binding protein YcdF (DUF218 family)
MDTDKAPHRTVTGSPRDTVSSSSQRWGKCPRRFRLFKRRTIWCPTWSGAFLIAALLLIPTAWWFSSGESFLSVTDRLQPDVLVVEGWIGLAGVRAAETEFEQHGYRYIVATGDLHTDLWDEDHLSFAEMTARELIRLGVPENAIIVAPAKETERHRTYQSCVAVRLALQARGMQPKTLNVFTLGPHARRSRLIFAKVEGPATKVGVVSWAPAGFQGTPWWLSSRRAKALITETVGYVYEALLNSGRGSNSAGDASVLPSSVDNG